MTALAVLGGLAVIAAPTPAQAEEMDSTPWAWGLAAAELGVVGEVTLLAGHHVDDGNPLVLMAPAALGVGAGLVAYRWDLDGAPAYAVHGAVWGGVDLMLIGMLIDGRDDRVGLEVGTATRVLGAVGAAGLGYLGATVGAHDPRLWLVAPTAGVGAGLIVGLVVVGATHEIGGDRMMHHLGVSVAAGLTTSLVVAAIANATHADPKPAARLHGITPSLSPSPGRMLISFSGAF